MTSVRPSSSSSNSSPSSRARGGRHSRASQESSGSTLATLKPQHQHVGFTVHPLTHSWERTAHRRHRYRAEKALYLTKKKKKLIKTHSVCTIILTCPSLHCRASRGLLGAGRRRRWVCRCRLTQAWRCPSTATPWCSLRPTQGLSRKLTKDTQTASSTKMDSYGEELRRSSLNHWGKSQSGDTTYS